MESKQFFEKLAFFLFFTLFTIGTPLNAQTKAGNKALEKEILQMDSILFGAYNTQDLEQIKTLFTEDLEFFHDGGGLAHYTQVIAGFKDIFSRDYVIQRELVSGSTEVHPIPNYGAIQIGEHTMCHPENGEEICGTFKFMHIWQKKEGQWKVSRIVSYNH